MKPYDQFMQVGDMIYLIGGAPRTGKSILCQRFSVKQKIGWIYTDLLCEMLRLKNETGVKTEWNASPEAIAAAAEWFFPYLERFIWGVSSHAGSYLIEGVDFLPVHVVQLSKKYPVTSIFLGRSKMTLDQLDRFPGHSPGYAGLPEEMRLRIVQDVPLWSEFIQHEASRYHVRYIDTSGDFSSNLDQAEAVLAAGVSQ